jgi:hypothetical protein
MARASRRGVGKIAATAVVIVMVAMMVGVGGFFASQSPPERLSAQQIISLQLASSSVSQTQSVSSSAQSTCPAGATFAETIGSSAPACGCALVDSNSNGSLYVSPDPKVGDDVCVQAYFSDSGQAHFSITNSTGSLVFSASCVAGQAPGTSGGPADESCLAFWNTANPDPQGDAIGAGSYRLVATGASAADSLGANFTLS